MEAKKIPSAKATRPLLIEKEQVPFLKFPSGDVLQTPIEKNDRNQMLKIGMRLGNSQKRKIKIFFEDTEGLKKVETTVWAATKNNVVLKKGVLLPVHRIKEIRFY